MSDNKAKVVYPNFVHVWGFSNPLEESSYINTRTLVRRHCHGWSIGVNLVVVQDTQDGFSSCMAQYEM